MKHTAWLVLVATLLLLVWARYNSADAQTETQPPLPFTLPEGFTAEVFVEGLDLPTSIAFAPDGTNRLFVNELHTGRIRIVENDVLRDDPFATLETNVSGDFPVEGENGLLGLAFDKQYAANRYVYVTYTVRTPGGIFSTIARFTDVNNKGEDFTVLLDSIPAVPGHQIQSLTSGPDGKVYVSVGDAYLDYEAQNVDSPLGKILRMNPDGSLPDDNPFPGFYTYAYGLRNSFDLAFNEAGELFSVDNGPRRKDELNRVVARGNYGWPIQLGEHKPDAVFINPLHTWRKIVSPAGMVFYQGTQFPAAYRGKLFLVLFGSTFSKGPSSVAKRVQVVDVDATPPTFEDFAVYTFTGTGNILDITEGPDGSLYLAEIFQGKIFRISFGG